MKSNRNSLALIGVFMLCAHLANSQCITPNCVAFGATRSTRLESGALALPFENLTVNDPGVFDLETSHFTAPQSGLYWFHFSVGMEPGQAIDVRLQGSRRNPNIPRPNTAFNDTPSTTSRDELVQLDANTELWLSSDSALYSDEVGRQTSFNGFLLNTLMDPLVAFSVGATASLVNAAIYTRITYDTVFVDTHHGWNAANNEYVAQVAGTYVLSIQLGAYPLDTSTMDFYINGVAQFFVALYDYTHSGADMVSRSFVTPLLQGDQLFTMIHNTGHCAYSDIRYQTLIMGFMYAPFRTPPISWSVARDGMNVIGLVNPVPFDVIFANQGNGWDDLNSRFVAPMSGVYYVHITAGVYLDRAKMELLHNGSPVANVHHESESETNNRCTLSRAIILRLVQGDTLHIRVPEGYQLFAVDGYRYSSFSGFRLYA